MFPAYSDKARNSSFNTRYSSFNYSKLYTRLNITLVESVHWQRQRSLDGSCLPEWSVARRQDVHDVSSHRHEHAEVSRWLNWLYQIRIELNISTWNVMATTWRSAPDELAVFVPLQPVDRCYTPLGYVRNTAPVVRLSTSVPTTQIRRFSVVMS